METFTNCINILTSHKLGFKFYLTSSIQYTHPNRSIIKCVGTVEILILSIARLFKSSCDVRNKRSSGT